MKVIKLKKFGSTLASRLKAKEIFDELEDLEITVDFEGVNDVSPSFAHQMLEIVTNKKIKVKLKNTSESTNDQIRKALSVIRANQE
jgi:hypothetical protein